MPDVEPVEVGDTGLSVWPLVGVVVAALALISVLVWFSIGGGLNADDGSTVAFVGPGVSIELVADDGVTPEMIEAAIGVMKARVDGLELTGPAEIVWSGSETVTVNLPGVVDSERAEELILAPGVLSLRPVLAAYSVDRAPMIGSEELDIDPLTGLTVEDNTRAESYLIYQDTVGPQVLHVGEAQLTGDDIADVVPFFDSQTEGWLVSLDLTSEGGAKFASLTAAAAEFPLGDPRRQIAVVLDGVVETAPVVDPSVSPSTGITGGRAVITLGASEDAEIEASDLALVLRYGSLPVKFEVVETTTLN